MAFTEKIKLQVRRKAHLACCLCKNIGVEIHHIIPQKENGPNTEENAAPLCPACHETYGANPTKRKFIREARDLWYEICENRYGADSDRIDEILKLLKKTVSYGEFTDFKEEIMEHMHHSLSTPREEEQIFEEIEVLLEKIWYDRHHSLRAQIEAGKTTVDPEIWKGALKAATAVEEKYPREELGPWSSFEWGMLNGKLSALRWVAGEQWDMLDT